MIKLIANGVLLKDGVLIESTNESDAAHFKGTMAYGILNKHNAEPIEDKEQALRLKFDALTSHDITYVGIIQTAKASGLERFPVPYVLTNCHNSLSAVGGTINEDDHVFGLSAAEKYGGIYVPPHLAVIHTYMREVMAGGGRMILGSDSHTRYGALGTMAVGEGGPELVKQLLSKTYDIKYPKVTAIYLTGKPKKGVGPQDVALSIIKAVFDNKFVNNKVMEFVGDGIANLPIEYRNGIDVMTTETTCLSSIWQTDDIVKDYYITHKRKKDYRKVAPKSMAYYDSAVVVELDKIEPMIALPFHPKNAYSIRELQENLEDILALTEAAGNQILGGRADFRLRDKIVDGKLKTQQGIIAGCAGGTYDSICMAANILDKCSVGCHKFSLSVYPGSQQIYSAIAQNGIMSKLIKSGAVIKNAFCGPCFGAGDVPANNALSIRHTTRNFVSREGSKPSEGQIASVALMDAMSIAATALNGGILTAATEVDFDEQFDKFVFDKSIYQARVYGGFLADEDDVEPDEESELTYGPNIADWPKMYALPKNLILEMASVIHDEVTTTDELIPSGEASSYRSNPLRLAEFALSRKDPEYVGRAKQIDVQSKLIRECGICLDKAKAECADVSESAGNAADNICLDKKYIECLKLAGVKIQANDPTAGYPDVALGSVIFAKKPGDGSAREQAASCQRVLGGVANIANSYATKRYRSNLINWGMLPFISQEEFEVGDILVIKDIRDKFFSANADMAARDEVAAEMKDGQNVQANEKENAGLEFDCSLIRNGSLLRQIKLSIESLTDDEKEIIILGSLINYYSAKRGK